ncbi:hypothetical protein FACS189413_08340 [Bacteroidia bacterium]|nr:hypothetical protein FACS189413_08340 [Bacteroidia bacterium]
MLAVSCGSGGGGNSPSAISKSIYSQVQKGNYEKAFEIMADNIDNNKENVTTEERSQFVKGFAEMAKQQAKETGGVKSFEIVKEEIAEDGNSATVDVKLVYGNGKDGTEIHKYVKKDGVWKFKLL